MTKFLKELQEVMTGRRMPGRTGLVQVTTDIRGIEFEELVEYRISVTLGRLVHCRPEDLPRMKRNILIEIREQIYGEFRDHLLELERIIFAQDFTSARDKVREILTCLYD